MVQENFDASDSLICGIGYVNKLRFKSQEPEIVSVEENTEGETIKIKYTVSFCGEKLNKVIEVPKF